MFRLLTYEAYHIHSHESNLYAPDSAVYKDDYAKRIMELGMHTLSSCEHGMRGNIWHLNDLCQTYQKQGCDLHWRYVVEAYMVKDRTQKDATNAHILLAAKDAQGMRELNRVLSEANMTGFYYRPRLDIPLLLTLSPEHVIVTTACVGGIWRYPDAQDILKQLHAHFGRSLFLEVQYHHPPRQVSVNKEILDFHHSLGIPLIMGTDSHFITPDQAADRLILLESRHISYPEEEGWFMDFPDPTEAYVRFQKQGVLNDAQIREAMEHTLIFNDFADIPLPRDKKIPNVRHGMSMDERNALYRSLVMQGFDKERDALPKQEIDRRLAELEYEMSAVTDTGMADYFIASHDIVQEGLRRGGVLTRTGRGSGVSYATNYYLGLTSVNRLTAQVTLFPDRFISRERMASGSMPDLDLNVADPEPFVDAAKSILGTFGVAPMVAFGKLASSAAYKMYARANGIPFELANDVTRALRAYEKALKYATDDESVSLSDYLDAQQEEDVRLSEPYQGLIASISPHPCAHLLLDGDIREEIGLISLRGVLAAYIDGNTAAAYGYLKEDFLTVDVVSVNQRACELAGIPMPDVQTLLDQTQRDAETWNLYARGNVIGLNQCEQPRTREKVMRYQPRNIVELSAFVAAVRPSFQSNLEQFLRRERFSYGVQSFDDLVKQPQLGASWLLYQEQLMAALQHGGISPSDSYTAIKAISKKDAAKIDSFRERFLSGFTERIARDEHMPYAKAQDTARHVWQIIEDAASYGFNACLSGDTKIMRPGATSRTPSFTLEEMFRIRWDEDYARRTGRWSLHQKFVRNGYGAAWTVDEHGVVRMGRILDIRFQGVRPMLQIVTRTGRSVRCTKEHRFPTRKGMVRADRLRIGDRLLRFRKDTALGDAITQIIPCGEGEVYDVEMDKAPHTFALANGLFTGNSHAYCVALDSLYGAYLKAHHPLQFYAALLECAVAKRKKQRAASIRREMQEAFHIRVSPCRIGQDNRSYLFDEQARTISESIASIRFLSQKAAQCLYEHFSARQPDCFSDVLVELASDTRIDTRQIEMLVSVGYFDRYGGGQKLMRVLEAFKDGPIRYATSYCAKTKAERLRQLRLLERDLPNEDFTDLQKAHNELLAYGRVLSSFPSLHGLYAVEEVDELHGVSLLLYHLATGKSGSVRVAKAFFSAERVEAGDVLRLTAWQRRPVYRRQQGEFRRVPGQTAIWADHYERIASRDMAS